MIVPLGKYTIFSRAFLLSVLCGVGAHVLNLGALLPQIIASQYDVVYYYDYSIGFGAFGSLFVLAPTISCGLIFWEEKQQNYFRLIVTRTPKWRYLLSRIICAVFTGALSATFIMLTTMTLLRCFLPMIEINHERIIDLQSDFHGYLWAHSTCLKHLFFGGILVSLNGMLWSLVALTVSTFTDNRFVILSCPIVVSQMLDIFYSLLDAPNAIQPYHLLSGYFVLGSSMIQELTAVLLIYGCYLLPLMIVFIKRAWRVLYE